MWGVRLYKSDALFCFIGHRIDVSKFGTMIGSPPYYESEKCYPDRFNQEDHERLRAVIGLWSINIIIHIYTYKFIDIRISTCYDQNMIRKGEKNANDAETDDKAA
jgi:hypothetical protein